jgi:hypothetical protein
MMTTPYSMETMIAMNKKTGKTVFLGVDAVGMAVLP